MISSNEKKDISYNYIDTSNLLDESNMSKGYAKLGITLMNQTNIVD